MPTFLLRFTQRLHKRLGHYLFQVKGSGLTGLEDSMVLELVGLIGSRSSEELLLNRLCGGAHFARFGVRLDFSFGQNK